jgi:hypothetical protein
MPKPNRPERRLHLYIEALKILAASLVIIAGGIMAILYDPVRQALMAPAIIGGTVILAVAAFLASVVIAMIRELPDDD